MKLWRISYMEHMKNGEIHVSSLSVMSENITSALGVANDILDRMNNADVHKVTINLIELLENEDIFDRIRHKQDICSLLLRTCREAFGLEHLNTLKFIGSVDSDDEYVVARWADGSSRHINVSMDSDIAMIRDIMRSIE